MIGGVHVELQVPELHGDGCLLRPWSMADLPAVVDASYDPVIPLITSVPPNGSEQECREYIERQWARAREGDGYSFAVCAATEPGSAAGHIGLWPSAGDTARASTGYWLTASARGIGLAARALATLASWAFTETGVARMHLYVEPWNVASIRTAERAGFAREGLLRSWLRIGDQRRDMYVYARLAADGLGPGAGSRARSRP